MIALLALVSIIGGKAQTITGRVFDQLNNEPLVGATVNIEGATTGAVTYSGGRYRLEDLGPGRVNLVVSYVGYQPIVIDNVWIKSGKITEQNIYLERSFDLDEVVVSAAKPLVQPGKISITEEQINRYAATYYDPARLITSSPDVAVTNDQNNEISVRGLAPSYNVWKLEGVEIVNPNHLSNAGTFFDQPTATGGGVNMLSAQMLDRSEFLYSTFDNRNGNSVGGIFNMNLKKGTDQDRQYTAQASLIGLDFATEGPFRQGGKTTYAANYRYSFTGLLAGMGVDFGGESIGFQDVSFNITTPIGDRSELKVFGVGGLSYNDFRHLTFEESEREKDRKDIYYSNKTGIVGASWTKGYDKGSVNVAAAYSHLQSKRDQFDYDSFDERDEEYKLKLDYSLFSFVISNKFTTGNGNIEVGVMQNLYSWDYQSLNSVMDFNPHGNFSIYDQFLTRPYAILDGYLGSNFTYKLGVSSQITSSDYTFEPRVSTSLFLGPKHVLNLGIGMYSQLLNPYNYYHNAGYGEMYRSREASDYSLLNSIRGTLSHDLVGSNLTMHSELFYYYFPEVNSLVSNEKEMARTYGLSVSLNRDFSKMAYVNLGASLLDSEVDVYENFFNTGYSLTLSTGKEWDFSNSTKNRRLSLDLRGMYQGGYRPYQNTNYASQPLDYYDQRDYLRFDLRVVWKRYHENRTTSFALDLQNVANIENFAYQYYDSFTRQWETQNQLGLIPILAYRVEW